MNNQALSKIWVLIILVVILAGGIFVWQYWNKLIETEEIKKEKVEEEALTGPEGWQKYINEKYGYAIFYPSQWETEDLSKEPGGHFRVFAESPAKKFIENFGQVENGILIHVVFSKLPLGMFMEYGSNIASSFLQTPSQEITINGKKGLLYTSASAESGIETQCIAVKNNDYAITIFIGGDYEKEVYDMIFANFHLIEPEGIFVREKETISIQDWKLYTDEPFGRNPFGYSVPGWSLSMKFPPNLEGSEGVFSILEKDTKEPSGVELQVWVNLLGGELEEKFKTLIMQYVDTVPGEAIRDINSQSVIKIDDINLDGCVGPQVFVEVIGASNILGYQTLCLLGDEVGAVTVAFSLQTYRERAELLDKYKPLYDTIISTFRYEKF